MTKGDAARFASALVLELVKTGNAPVPKTTTDAGKWDTASSATKTAEYITTLHSKLTEYFVNSDG